MSGYVALHRDAFNHPLLKDAERFRAWFWLVANAAWKPTKHDARGQIITVERGQICAGREYLAKVWGWSPSAVERFLTRLETEQMIERKAGQGKSVITICNYSKYQDADNETGQTTGQTTGQKSDRHRTAKEERNHYNQDSDGGGDARATQSEASGMDPREGWDDERVSLGNLANRFAVAGGVALDFKNLSKAIDQVKAWLALTTDTELIETAIRQKVLETEERQINSLKFFNGAVRTAVAKQEAQKNGHQPTRPTTFLDIALACAAGGDFPGSEYLESVGLSGQPPRAELAALPSPRPER